MSNALAIAAVTSSLVNLITVQLREVAANPSLNFPSGVSVTAQPPDAANNDTFLHQVNLFLYNVMPNAAWRNMPVPSQVKRGESAMPPLALNLYYLITAYTRDTSDGGDTSGHKLLGTVMSIVNDHAILKAADLAIPESDLQNQVDGVRLTLQPLSVEEIFRLWSGFQAQYRTSVAYEASVVLIDSTLPTRTPLPVLQRGRDAGGTTVQPDPLPYPTLFSVQLANAKAAGSPGSVASPAALPPTALLQDVLVIAGHRLDGATVAARFNSQRLSTPIDIVVPQTNVPESSRTADEIRVKLLTDPAHPGVDLTKWPAGLYTVSAIINPGSKTEQATNELPFSLAPQIDTSQPITPTRDTNGDVTITLSCSPQVLPEQRVALLLGDQEIVVQPRPKQTNSLTFVAGNVASGDYLLRLRVDGVDSFPFTRTGDPITRPPTFDDKQRIQVP